MAHSLDRQLLELMAKHTGQLWVPYIETSAEHRFLRVERHGRLGDDVWKIHDGGFDRFHYGQCRFVLGRDDSETWEDYQAATLRPLAEAWSQAEAIAAEMRLEYENRVARWVAEAEKNRTEAHP